MSLPFRWEVFEASDPLLTPAKESDGEVVLEEKSNYVAATNWQIHEPDNMLCLIPLEGGVILAAEEETKDANASTVSDEKTASVSEGNEKATTRIILLSIVALVGISLFTLLASITPLGTVGLTTNVFTVCFLMVFVYDLATGGLTTKSFAETVVTILKELASNPLNRRLRERKDGK